MTSTTQTTTLGAGRLPGLDGLRAVSVTLVVLLHASLNADFPGGEVAKRVLGFGGFGVEVFFTISGFIITYLLCKEEAREGHFSLGAFYARRALRILPPAYVYLAFLCVAAAVGLVVVDPPEVLSSTLFFRNLNIGGSVYTGHYWSLAIEEQFYLVWPVLLAFVPARRRVSVVFALCVMAPMYRQANIELFGATAINWARADLRYDTLLYGALLALAVTDVRWSDRVRRVARLGDVLAAASVGAIVAAFFVESVLPGASAFTIPLRSVCVCALIACTITGDARMTGFLLNARPVVWLGTVSYSIYLWQQVVMYYPFESRQGLCAIRLGLVLLAGSASYYLVERTSDRVRTRLLARSGRDEAPQVGGTTAPIVMAAESAAGEGL